MHKQYIPASLRLLFLSSLLAASISGLAAEGSQTMSLKLQSPDFNENGPIAKTFTCDGDDISPALTWSGIPSNTKTLVLIIDDPDAPDPKAPKMTWVHWVLYNIPASAPGLAKAVSDEELPPGTLQGKNDWKKIGYRGPCPPTGKHRYFHKLYALDIELPDLNEPTKAELEQAMQGHILDKAEWVGTYER
ncbi:YbhB/YbcL family Raf kinase inhibitor-like protein [Methylotuvimicrobium sp. KM2]|uniref:YbhB/YbcL family Raf kinase inhibitor-like protein n=1 Tax=Methylotuvimicrobium sp. KM2 TaxID=3133976 RepID=UPI0031017F72